jgi:dolichol-phosphate mannosyltransferase
VNHESESRVLVALCTYNERENLPALVEAIGRCLPTADLLVVDDDSPDGTGQWADQAASTNRRLHVLIRRNQRGLGSALKEAMQYAIAQNYEWLLNLDADFSHDPADLPKLLELCRTSQPQLDCSVGTRYADGGRIEGWPTHRYWMSRTVNRFAKTALRLPVSDCSGSLRCYRVDALRKLDPQTLRSQGYAVFEEILLRLQKNGASFGELPIVFRERQLGVSKLTPAEAMRALSQLLRMRWWKS